MSDLLQPVGKSREGRILELDGLRALCVALVIISHWAAYSKALPVSASWLWLTGYGGTVGVRLFFTISGFIITRLTLEEWKDTGSFSVRRFFIKRFFRIIPAYWLYLAAATIAAVAGLIHANVANLLFCLTFTSNIFFLEKVFFYGHSWSLSVEEQYYALFPLVVLLLARKGLRTLTIVLGAFFLAGIASLHLREALHQKTLHIDVGFLANFRYIISGVLLAFWWETLRTFIDRVHGTWMVVIWATLVAMSYDVDVRLSIYLGKYLQLVAEPLLLAIFIGWIVRHPVHLGFLRAAPVQWVGKSSYSIYLWQQLFCGSPGNYETGRAFPLLVALPLILLVAGLSYYLVERPCNRWGHVLAGKMPRPRSRVG